MLSGGGWWKAMPSMYLSVPSSMLVQRFPSSHSYPCGCCPFALATAHPAMSTQPSQISVTDAPASHVVVCAWKRPLSSSAPCGTMGHALVIPVKFGSVFCCLNKRNGPLSCPRAGEGRGERRRVPGQTRKGQRKSGVHRCRPHKNLFRQSQWIESEHENCTCTRRGRGCSRC